MSYFLIFCLNVLCIVESGTLKSPTIILLLSIFFFRSVSVCSIYLGVLMLGAYTKENNPRSSNGIIFWRAGPLQYRLPLLGVCSRNPSVPVHQLVVLWKERFGFSEFFLKTQQICPFHDGWLTTAPVHITLSVKQFLTKNDMTPLPHPPYSPDLILSDYVFCPRWKILSKGNILPIWKKWNEKWQKHKKNQNWWVQKLFWGVEKKTQYVYSIKWRVLWRWLKFKCVGINTQFL